MTEKTDGIPAAALRAREMYVAGVPTRDILAETKLSLHTFYSWVNGRASPKGEQLLPTLPKRRIVKSLRISAGDRRSLVARMMRSAERQVAELELQAGSGRGDREKNARVLAIVCRAVRELSTLDSIDRELEKTLTERRPVEETGDDDRPPEDIDEFRNELARRIDALVAGRGDQEGSAEAPL